MSDFNQAPKGMFFICSKVRSNFSGHVDAKGTTDG